MVEFEAVNDVPEIKRHFVASQETLEVEAIMGGMKVGEVNKFPCEPNLRATQNFFHKCETARKHSIGEFKIFQRGFNVFIERVN